MRTHRRDSVHVLAVTRAVVLEICSRRRFIFKMSTNRGKGKNNSFSMIFFFPIKGMKVQQENYKLRFSDHVLLVVVAQSSQFLVRVAMKLINL